MTLAPIHSMKFVALVCASCVTRAAGVFSSPAPTADPQAAKEKEAKMGAVKRVVGLLEDLQANVYNESEREAKTYDKFACFCKDTTTDKNQAVTDGGNEKTTIVAELNRLDGERAGFDGDIKGFEDDITTAEADIKSLKADHKKALALYLKNDADLQEAIYGCKKAIEALEAAKRGERQNVTLVQVQDLTASIQEYANLASILGVEVDLGGNASSKAPLEALVQEAMGSGTPAPDYGAYTFKSGSILSTVKTVCGTFDTKKTDVDGEESTRMTTFNSSLTGFEDSINTSETGILTKQGLRAKTVEDIGTNSRDLSGIEATLLDDQSYLSGISTICADKAATWDTRSKVRTDELTAITAAIGQVKGLVSDKTSGKTVRFTQRHSRLQKAEAILDDSHLMEGLEAEAEAADGGKLSFLQNLAAVQPHQGKFLQRRQAMWPFDSWVNRPRAESQAPASSEKSARQAPPLAAEEAFAERQAPPVAAEEASAQQRVAELLRSEGAELKSSMLVGLAAQVSGDKFAKVKVLLQELLERLLKQAQAEGTQKGWCDKSLSAAKIKRDHAAKRIGTLNYQMEKGEARKEKLEEEVSLLTDEITTLGQDQTDADGGRANETQENNATITEAKEGQDAVQVALDTLNHFYKAAAKGNAGAPTTTATPQDTAAQQAPAKDAPDAGFANEEAYKGDQGGADGAIGLLEVIQSDFTRTVVETEKAEKQAVRDHRDFSIKTQSSIKAKTVAKNEKTTDKSDVASQLTDDGLDLTAQNGILTLVIPELKQLHTACIDTAMSAEDRAAHRQQEIDALTKANCILNSYAEYGPDGATNANC